MFKLSELTYRRQFLIGNTGDNFDAWKKTKIKDDVFLEVHPDLEQEYLTVGNNKFVLLGNLVNPYFPERDNLENLKVISENSKSFYELLDKTYAYGGRWIIIFSNGNETKIVHDPCGMRQIYYVYHKGSVWCGSQPSILKSVLGCEESDDKDLLEYINSAYYEDRERPFFGDGTIYNGVKHLLPNHYLDIENNITERFWIDKEDEVTLDEAIKEVAEILKGSLLSISKRQKMMIAVTAGWDSRVLLAASKEIKDKVSYFVSTMNILSHNHMDVRVPRKLLEKLGLELNVIEDLQPLRDDFTKSLKKNVSRARVLPKTLTIQHHYDFSQNKISVNGNGSEIARSFYGNEHPTSSEIDGKYIMEAMKCPRNFIYVENELNEWLNEARVISEEQNMNIMDLFYWEQRMGNWGTMYQAEQDIAIEEFCPYNNRKLLMIMLKVNSKYRVHPDYIFYKKLIEYLWIDTLQEPINPTSVKSKLRRMLVILLPLRLKSAIKKKLMSRNVSV